MRTGQNLPTAITPLAKALGSLSAVAVTTSGSLTHLAGQPFQSLHRAIGAIQSQIVSLVQHANPAAVIRFKFAVEDLQAVLGRMLLPVLNNVTLVIQKLADYLHSASGPAKGLAAVMVTVGVVAAAVTGGFVGMTGALIVLKIAMDIFTGGITAIAGLIGAALGAATAGGIGAIGMGLVVTPFEQLKGLIDQIGPPLLKIFEMVGSAVMSFAGGALPGMINAIQTVVAGISSVVNAMGGAGNVFEIIGLVVGSFVQYLATGFQIVASMASILINTFKLLAGIIFDNVNIVGTLTGGLERMMVWLKAISILIGGVTEEETKTPGKAPPAVRQATSQSIQSFITKAYVSAFQVGGGEDKTVKYQNESLVKLEQIRAEAEKTANSIREFLTKAKDAAEAPASFAEGAIRGGTGPIQAGWQAVREMHSRVTGK